MEDIVFKKYCQYFEQHYFTKLIATDKPNCTHMFIDDRETVNGVIWKVWSTGQC